MNQVKQSLADHLTEQLVEQSDLPKKDIEDDVNNFVVEHVNAKTREEMYLEKVTSTPSRAFSRKPTNLTTKLTADVGELMPAALTGGIALTSGDENAIAAAVVTLLGTIYQQAKVPLSVEQGFVYYVGYTNRQDKWQIPEDELIDRVLNKCAELSNDILISDREDVEREIVHLERYGCIERIKQDGTSFVIFRETCQGTWG